MYLAIAINVGLATFFYVTSDFVVSVFTSDPEILELAHNVLLVEIFLELGRAVNIVMVGCLQAAGDIRTPMLVGIFGMWLCAVPLSYLLVFTGVGALLVYGLPWPLMKSCEVYCLYIVGIAVNGETSILSKLNFILPNFDLQLAK